MQFLGSICSNRLLSGSLVSFISATPIFLKYFLLAKLFSVLLFWCAGGEGVTPLEVHEIIVYIVRSIFDPCSFPYMQITSLVVKTGV